MNKFIGRHGEGKTKELITYAAENNLIIVSNRSNDIAKKAFAYGFTEVPVMSLADFKKLYVTNVVNFTENSMKKFVIDNIDNFLMEFFGACEGFSEDRQC